MMVAASNPTLRKTGGRASHPARDFGLEVNVYRAIFLLLMASVVFGQGKPEKDYPFKAKVTATYIQQVSPPSVRSTNTDCNVMGNNVGCTSTPQRVGAHSTYVSEIDLSDGNHYAVTCREGVMAGFSSGMAQGSGNDIVTGCKLALSEHPARWNKSRLVLQVFNRKNKPRELALDVISVKPQASSAQEPPGSVSVTSVPDGAEIYVDDSFVGNAPSKLNIPAGKHTVRLSVDGYKPWSRELTIQTGSDVKLNANLEKNM